MNYKSELAKNKIFNTVFIYYLVVFIMFILLLILLYLLSLFYLNYFILIRKKNKNKKSIIKKISKNKFYYKIKNNHRKNIYIFNY